MTKTLLIALIAGIPVLSLAGCTTEHIVRRQAPATETPAEPEPDPAAGEEEGTKPPGTTPPSGETPSNPVTPSTKPEDICLDGQDLDGADINISTCPALPEIPGDVAYAKKDKFGTAYDLGAWEIGTTKTGATYKYGTLTAAASTPRKLSYDGGEVEVNALNVECWAKGYYRLRKILQNPPVEYLALRNAGFQYRFFQFQTDLRNGPTGYKALASFQDHLVKWVTVISAAGVCQQPTISKFKAYATAELKTRGIALPPAN